MNDRRLTATLNLVLYEEAVSPEFQNVTSRGKVISNSKTLSHSMYKGMIIHLEEKCRGFLMAYCKVLVHNLLCYKSAVFWSGVL
jgi:hypothetical protein